MSIPMLALRDVHAAYLKKDVLRGVSLTVNTGEIVALLGENGSGKSTILKVVTGLLRPSKGTVRYRGRDLNGLDVASRQRIGIGYLIQGGRVFPNLTVGENFELALAQARDVRSESPRLGNWFPVLRDLHRKRAGLLSGGQRQMLAIELVFAQQPELLLMDEPTGALTEEFAIQMLRQVRHYVESRSAAALLVEHVLAVSDFATHRLHLTHGKITPSNGS